MSYPTKLPPSPDAGFLDVPIPDLSAVDESSPIAALRWQNRQKALDARADRKSASWLTEAARLKRDRGYFDEAITLSSLAFQQAFRWRAMDKACESLAIRSSAHHAKGEFNEAAQVVSQLKLLSQAEQDVRLAAIHDESEAGMHLRTVVRDWFADARDFYQIAFEKYGECGDAAGQIRTLAGLASAKSGIGVYLTSIEHVAAGLRLAAESEEWYFTGRLLVEAALAFRDQGYRHNIEALFKLAIEWCEFVGDAYGRIRAISGLAFLYDFEAIPTRIEDFEKSERTYDFAIAEAQQIGALPLELQARLDSLFLYKKFDMQDGLERQREMIDKQATILSGNKGQSWLDVRDDYEKFIEGRRRDRYITRLRDGIEGITEPFFIFDPIHDEAGVCGDFINEFRNSAGANLLGIDRGVVRTMVDLLLTPYFDGLREHLLNAVNQHVGYTDEISVPGPSGDLVWYARRVVPAGDGTVVTLRDSTDNRKLEAALRGAAESARQADRTKSEFLANMSHEVRTPIHGVLGLARLLADSNLDDDQRSYVEGIISSGDILLRVIGDVLDVSKIEARRMEVNVAPTDPRKLVSDVVALYRGQATERGLQISGEVAEEVPAAVMLDGPRVRQILGNLVGNAVKFTREGLVRIGLCQDGPWLEFEVVDTGMGLAPDQHEAIFRPFAQAAGGAQEGGTGLGLTISKRLTELMSGDLFVDSELGKGSRFWFRLPLVSTQGATSFEAAGAEPARFDGRRILLVEDNPVNVLVAKGLLAKLGCSVAVATNGLEAVNAVGSGGIELVLMDVRMPILDGLAATREIRSREAVGHLPIIALTAGTLVDERSECFDAGMDDYLPKPFTIDMLRETLSHWLPTP